MKSNDHTHHVHVPATVQSARSNGRCDVIELTTRDQRFATNFTSYPVAWARYNPTTVIFGPSPVSAYSTIWDVNTYSTALVATTETDPLPYPYTECVPYGAAALAKIDEQQYDEAREFWEMFEAELTTAINARTGATPNYYTMQRRPTPATSSVR